MRDTSHNAPHPTSITPARLGFAGTGTTSSSWRRRASQVRSMVGALTVCAAVFLLGALGVSDAPAQSQSMRLGQPSTQTPSTVLFPPVSIFPKPFDCTYADPNEVIRADFTIRNMGKKALRIAQVKASCKCTVPSISSMEIAPGGVVTMTALVDLRGHIGIMDKPVLVRFEGFAQPLRCRIAGEMQYAVRADPGSIKPGTMGNNGRITLESRDGRPFSILSVNGEPPTIVESYPAGSASALRHVIRYSLNPRAMLPMLMIETDHPDAPVLDIQIHTAVNSPKLEYLKNLKYISLSRKNANIGVLRPGESAEFVTTVNRKDRTPELEVFFLTDELDARIVEIGPGADEKSQSVMVRVTSKADRDGVIAERLYFQTGEAIVPMWVGGMAHRAEGADDAEDGEDGAEPAPADDAPANTE